MDTNRSVEPLLPSWTVGEVRAVDRVTLQIERGEFLGITGASGSGKSMVLNLLAGLDTPTSGHITFDGTPRAERHERAAVMLKQLGLADRLDHRPADLSGGEQQRVALARALIKQPELLLADEPTGNLDHENSLQIATLLKERNIQGLTVVMVTHDLELARNYCSRIVRMQYGQLVSDPSATTGGAA